MLALRGHVWFCKNLVSRREPRPGPYNLKNRHKITLTPISSFFVPAPAPCPSKAAVHSSGGQPKTPRTQKKEPAPGRLLSERGLLRRGVDEREPTRRARARSAPMSRALERYVQPADRYWKHSAG